MCCCHLEKPKSKAVSNLPKNKIKLLSNFFRLFQTFPDSSRISLDFCSRMFPVSFRISLVSSKVYQTSQVFTRSPPNFPDFSRLLQYFSRTLQFFSRIFQEFSSLVQAFPTSPVFSRLLQYFSRSSPDFSRFYNK